jgi:DNA excision repair protein ERCC-5
MSSSERGAAKMSGPSQSTAPGKKAFDFLETIPTVDEYASLHAATNVRDDSANMDPTTSGGVTEEMRNEVMELLHLFGIPYIVAPAEAEAQCVELERLGLVDGIVTEDSDAFVFGGKIVYKNLFKDQKYLEAYHSADAKDEMNLTRDSFVALAMLLGGDYTEGIKGVGIVNAMEILLAFGISEDCKAGLTRFREWLDGFDPEDLVKGGDSKNKSLGVSDDFHRKHRTARSRWVAPKYFPDDKVMTAYWNPVVDNSEERFSWGEPDLDGLILFLNKQLGWPAEQTKTLINPIIDRLKRTRMHQTRLDSFMKYEDGIKFADIRSKRLQSVLNATVAKKKTGNTSGEEKKNEK